MRSSSSSRHSATAGSSASSSHDPNVADSAAASSRPSSQPALLPSSGLPLQSRNQSRANHGSASGAGFPARAPSVLGDSPRRGAPPIPGVRAAGMESESGRTASAPAPSQPGAAQGIAGLLGQVLGSNASQAGTRGAPHGEGRLPITHGSTLTELYVGLVNQASEVEARITQHEAAGLLTPEQAAAYRLEASGHAAQDANFGKLVSQLGIERSQILQGTSTSSGASGSGKNQPSLAKQEGNVVDLGRVLSTRWRMLGEDVDKVAGGRDAILKIHEDLSVQAANLMQDIESLAASGEWPDHVIDRLRDRCDELNHSNERLRASPGSLISATNHSKHLREQWSILRGDVDGKQAPPRIDLER